MKNPELLLTRRDALQLLSSGVAAMYLGLDCRLAKADVLVPLGDDRFFSRLDSQLNTPGTQIIDGVNFTLDQTMIPATHHLIVRGYEITLNGPLSLPGYNILILAQKLNCGAGTTISTAGTTGSPSYTNSHAAPPTGLGQDGHDGAPATSTDGLHAPAGKGTNGGNITILAQSLTGQLILQAPGGAGGDAESGSDGAPGTPGANASPPNHPGVQGGPGGQGGHAGVPGNGGNAGTIRVGTLVGLQTSQIQSATMGGPSGNPGQNGKPGTGGPSGTAGQGTYSHTALCRIGGEKSHMGPCQVQSPWSAPGGSLSVTPPALTTTIPVGIPGIVGNANLSATTLAELAANLTPLYVDMLLRSAVNNYINQDFASSLNQLIFIKSLVSTRLRSPAPMTPTGNDLVRLTSSSSKVDALIRQLQLNLDYYAQPLNHVPRLSVADYQSQVSTLLTLGGDISAEYLKYKSLVEAQKQAVSDFAAARSKALSAITSAQAASQDLVTQQTDTLNAIARLETALSETWVDLLGAQDAFKIAVAAIGQPGCQFTQVLAVAAAIAATYVTAGAAAPAIPAALAAASNSPMKYDNGQPVLDDFSGFKYKVSKVVTVGQDAVSIIDAFNKLKSSFPAPTPGQPVPTLPNDEVKILASVDQIEAAIKPYLNLPEAQNYQTLIKLFVATSEARNNKILEYNTLDSQIAKTNADIHQAQVVADNAQNAVSAVSNPFLGDAVSFMTDAWINALNAIVYVIYQMRSAYKYYALVDAPINIQDFSIGSLSSSALDLYSRYKQTMDTFGGDPQNIVGFQVDLTPYLSSGTLTRFRQTGIATVAIDAANHDLSNYSYLYVTRVWIRLESSSGILKTFQTSITHEGRALLFDSSKKPFVFSHLPVTVGYQVLNGNDVVDGNIAGQQSSYAGLTPYGPWTLKIDLQSIPHNFLASLTKISLMFDGKGRGVAAA